METIKLWFGNCLELMTNIEDNFVDLIFTSPPYYNAKDYSFWNSYNDYLEFMRGITRQFYRVLNKDGFFIMNTSPIIISRRKRSEESIRYPIPFDLFSISQQEGFKYIDDIIWEKPDGASQRARNFSQNRRPCAYKPFVVTEYLFVMRKHDAPLIDFAIRKHPKEIIEKSLVKDGYERTNVWKISPARNKEHPAIFPEELSSKIIEYYSYIGDTVLDPFMGIGTTGISSKKLNRNFIGIEKVKKYFDIALKTINE